MVVEGRLKLPVCLKSVSVGGIFVQKIPNPSVNRVVLGLHLHENFQIVEALLRRPYKKVTFCLLEMSSSELLIQT